MKEFYSENQSFKPYYLIRKYSINPKNEYIIYHYWYVLFERYTKPEHYPFGTFWRVYYIRDKRTNKYIFFKSIEEYASLFITEKVIVNKQYYGFKISDKILANLIESSKDIAKDYEIHLYFVQPTLTQLHFQYLISLNLSQFITVKDMDIYKNLMKKVELSERELDKEETPEEMVKEFQKQLKLTHNALAIASTIFLLHFNEFILREGSLFPFFNITNPATREKFRTTNSIFLIKDLYQPDVLGFINYKQQFNKMIRDTIFGQKLYDLESNKNPNLNILDKEKEHYNSIKEAIKLQKKKTKWDYIPIYQTIDHTYIKSMAYFKWIKTENNEEIYEFVITKTQSRNQFFPVIRRFKTLKYGKRIYGIQGLHHFIIGRYVIRNSEVFLNILLADYSNYVDSKYIHSADALLNDSANVYWYKEESDDKKLNNENIHPASHKGLLIGRITLKRFKNWDIAKITPKIYATNDGINELIVVQLENPYGRLVIYTALITPTSFKNNTDFNWRVLDIEMPFEVKESQKPKKEIVLDKIFNTPEMQLAVGAILAKKLSMEKEANIREMSILKEKASNKDEIIQCRKERKNISDKILAIGKEKEQLESQLENFKYKTSLTDKQIKWINNTKLLKQIPVYLQSNNVFKENNIDEQIFVNHILSLNKDIDFMTKDNPDFNVNKFKKLYDDIINIKDPNYDPHWSQKEYETKNQNYVIELFIKLNNILTQNKLEEIKCDIEELIKYIIKKEALIKPLNYNPIIKCANGVVYLQHKHLYVLGNTKSHLYINKDNETDTLTTIPFTEHQISGQALVEKPLENTFWKEKEEKPYLKNFTDTINRLYYPELVWKKIVHDKDIEHDSHYTGETLYLLKYKYPIYYDLNFKLIAEDIVSFSICNTHGIYLTVNNEIFGWGYNTHQQIYHRSSNNIIKEPIEMILTRIRNKETDNFEIYKEVCVKSFFNWQQMKQEGYSLFLTDDNDIYGIGGNSRGQLGHLPFTTQEKITYFNSTIKRDTKIHRIIIKKELTKIDKKNICNSEENENRAKSLMKEFSSITQLIKKVVEISPEMKEKEEEKQDKMLLLLDIRKEFKINRDLIEATIISINIIKEQKKVINKESADFVNKQINTLDIRLKEMYSKIEEYKQQNNIYTQKINESINELIDLI